MILIEYVAIPSVVVRKANNEDIPNDKILELFHDCELNIQHRHAHFLSDKAATVAATSETDTGKINYYDFTKYFIKNVRFLDIIRTQNC